MEKSIYFPRQKSFRFNYLIVEGYLNFFLWPVVEVDLEGWATCPSPAGRCVVTPALATSPVSIYHTPFTYIHPCPMCLFLYNLYKVTVTRMDLEAVVMTSTYVARVFNCKSVGTITKSETVGSSKHENRKIMNFHSEKCILYYLENHAGKSLC